VALPLAYDYFAHMLDKSDKAAGQTGGMSGTGAGSVCPCNPVGSDNTRTRQGERG